MKKKDVIFSLVLLLVASTIFLSARAGITGYFTFNEGWEEIDESWDDNVNTVSESYIGGCSVGGCPSGQRCENNSDGFVIWMALCQSFTDQSNCFNSEFLGGKLCSWSGNSCTYNPSWLGNDGSKVYGGFSGIPIGSPLSYKDLDDPTMVSFRIGDLLSYGFPLERMGIYQEGCVEDTSGKKGLFGDCSVDSNCLSGLCTPFGYCSVSCETEGQSYSYGANTYYCYNPLDSESLFRVDCLNDDHCGDGYSCNDIKMCEPSGLETVDPPLPNPLRASGSGVITISNCQDLSNLMNSQTPEKLSKNYILNQSFNCQYYNNLKPIGTYDIPFTGTFDGKGYIISNIKIDHSSNSREGDSTGLFGNVAESAVITNLNLNNVKISGEFKYILWSSGIFEGGVGSLVGFNKGNISKCHVSGGDVFGDRYGAADQPSGVGGLVGLNKGITNLSSVSLNSVKGFRDSSTGGLVGFNDYILINSNSTVNKIEGGHLPSGGLVGSNGESGQIIRTNSLVKEIVGTDEVGGLVGGNHGGLILDSHSDGNPICTIKGDNMIGGLVGFNRGSISNSYSKDFHFKSDLNNKNGFGACKINRNQPNYFGGLVGFNRGNINNSFTSENLLFLRKLGSNHPEECVSSKDNYYGQLIGKNDGTQNNNFYYVELDSIGAIAGEGNTGKYLNKINFRSDKIEPLKSWDFINVWEIKQGYSYPQIRLSGYESSDCVFYSNNLAEDPQSDRKCISNSDCVYSNSIYPEDERIIHKNLVYICSENSWEKYNPLKGEGTTDYPYEIEDCLDLQSIKNNLSAVYVLSRAINCSETKEGTYWKDGKGFSPIDHFIGELNGNNFSISDLYINRETETEVGLFKNFDRNIKVKNLNLLNVNITGEDFVGSLVGIIKNKDSEIINVNSSGYVKGSGKVGGLVGESAGKIYHSSFSGVVDGIERSQRSTDNADGEKEVGGLVGHTRINSLVENSFVKIKIISGDDKVGGLIGYNEGVISKSYSEVNLLDGDQRVGGFVGENQGSVLECYTSFTAETGGGINAGWRVGGLVGSNGGIIKNSFVDGKGVIGSYRKIGGLVGYNENITENCYVRDILIRGNKGEVGGLVGENSGRGSIINSFSSSLGYDINSDATNKGFFVGKNDGNIQGGYYSTSSSSVYSAIGSGTGESFLVNFPSDFYSPQNEPLKSWNFISIWKSYTSTYPKLQAFPLKACLEDADCEARKYCNDEKICADKLSNFEDCNRDEMCESGLCGSNYNFLPSYCFSLSNQNNECPDGGYLFEQDFCVQCLGDTNCSEGYYCENYKCVPGCSNDDPCANLNQFCLSGRCIDKKATGSSDGCQQDEQCISGVCSNNKCVACTDSKHGICSNNQYCLDNKCEDNKGLLENCNDQNPCVKDLICNPFEYCSMNASLCSNNLKPYDWFCVDCNNNLDCGPGKVCNDRKLCVNECNNVGVNGSCISGQYCNGTQCVDKKDYGEECTNGKEFANWMCESKICKDVGGIGICVDCTAHDNCSDNQFCGKKDNKCTALFNGGQNCSDDYQCESGNCHRRVCVECENDGQCDSSQYCDGNSYNCLFKKEIFNSCSADKECDSNYCSKFGYCAPIFNWSTSTCSSGFVLNENNSLYCVQCLSQNDCDGIGNFCKSNYLCENNSYLVESIPLYGYLPFNEVDSNKNELTFNITDTNITINSIESSFDEAFLSGEANLYLNLSIPKVGTYYNYSYNSTISIGQNNLTLIPNDPLKINVSYGENYNTIIDLPVNYTLICSPYIKYNFTHLNSATQQYQTYYCINGTICEEGKPCAVISSPLNGTSKTYMQNFTFDFFKYPNNQSFNYSWSSDRLSLDPTKKPISSWTIEEYFLDELGPINLTLNVSNGLTFRAHTITFISSTETPACYREGTNAYWVYNDIVERVGDTNIRCDKYDGVCCPDRLGCATDGTCDEVSTYGFFEFNEDSPLSCSSYTDRGSCEAAIFNLTYSFGSLGCGTVTNITKDDGTNQTIRTDCDCVWNFSGDNCFTNATEKITKYCLADSDCDAGKYCDSDADTPTCEEISNYCTHDENCSRGKLCNETLERCYEPDGYCTRNSDCISIGKYCNESSYRCELCSTNNQCPSGYYCAITGYCRVSSTTPTNNNPSDPLDDLYIYITQPNTNNNSSEIIPPSPNDRWLWIIPTIIFLGVVILVIFILKKYNVKKNKFDSDNYKKNSKLPPFPPSMNPLPQQRPNIQSPPRQPINQQFPPTRPQNAPAPFNPHNKPKPEEKK